METVVENAVGLSTSEKSKGTVSIHPLPKKGDIGIGTILVTMTFPTGGHTVWAISFTGVPETETPSLSLLEVSLLLSDVDAIPDDAVVAAVFQIKELNEGSPFPYVNGGVYARPTFDADGILDFYELMAKNNEDYFIFWNIEEGFEIKDSKTSETLLVYQYADQNNPHFIGKDALLLIEERTNARILFSVFQGETWQESEWNYVIGSMLAMCYGTVEGYTFASGKTEIEETVYSDRLMGAVNEVNFYRLAISDKENEGVTAIDLDASCVVLRLH